MKPKKYLALDFGAESGRVILGVLENKKIHLEDIHRFPNKIINIHGNLHWDIFYLFDEALKGIKKCFEKGHNDIKSIAVDTWGVDFGLISKDDKILETPYSYRDKRTNGILKNVYKKIPKEQIYELTGNQVMPINTAFQLFSMVEENSSILKYADKLLFMPDLFNFLLTGVKRNEYTISSTSQLLNPVTKKWEKTIFNKLNIPKKLMSDIIFPGTKIGKLHKSISKQIGKNNIKVIAVGSHDTASAVAAIPNLDEKGIFISSGTWSLIGAEISKPIVNKLSQKYNFTNEGGVGNKIRFLSNMTGFWIIQKLKREWETKGKSYTYSQLNKLAEKEKVIDSTIDVDSVKFSNPASMIEAIDLYLKSTKQKLPKSDGMYVRLVLESMAEKYKDKIDKLNKVLNRKLNRINIVGGGSQNYLLNQLTANKTELEVYAGPVEATSLGNIITQAISFGDIKSLEEGREIIKQSQKIEKFVKKNY